MWEIIPYITTPISLIAFVFGIIYFIKRTKINADIKKLKDIDPKDKANLLVILEEKYAYKTEDLTKEQRYNLAKSQLADVSKKRRDQLLFYSFMAVLFLLMFIFSLFKNASNNNNEGSKIGILAKNGTPSIDTIKDTENEVNEISKNKDIYYFVRSNPYLYPFKDIKVGDKISDIATIYKNNRYNIDLTKYFLVITEITHPKVNVFLDYLNEQPNPRIISLRYYIDDTDIFNKLKTQVLMYFKKYPHSSDAFNKVIKWQNISGFEMWISENDFRGGIIGLKKAEGR